MGNRDAEVERAHEILDEAGLAMNARGRMILADRIRTIIERMKNAESLAETLRTRLDVGVAEWKRMHQRAAQAENSVRVAGLRRMYRETPGGYEGT